MPGPAAGLEPAYLLGREARTAGMSIGVLSVLLRLPTCYPEVVRRAGLTCRLFDDL